MDTSQTITYLTFCILLYIIETTYGRSITDVPSADGDVGDENNWANDPEYSETDRKTFTKGF